jgi:hypothetical protein
VVVSSELKKRRASSLSSVRRGLATIVLAAFAF